MTREERALEVYPVEIVGCVTECRVGATPKPQDWNEHKREYYIEGFNACKDAMMEWLNEMVYLWENSLHGSETDATLKTFREVINKVNEL